MVCLSLAAEELGLLHRYLKVLSNSNYSLILFLQPAQRGTGAFALPPHLQGFICLQMLK